MCSSLMPILRMEKRRERREADDSLGSLVQADEIPFSLPSRDERDARLAHDVLHGSQDDGSSRPEGLLDHVRDPTFRPDSVVVPDRVFRHLSFCCL